MAQRRNGARHIPNESLFASKSCPQAAVGFHSYPQPFGFHFEHGRNSMFGQVDQRPADVQRSGHLSDGPALHDIEIKDLELLCIDAPFNPFQGDVSYIASPFLFPNLI